MRPTTVSGDAAPVMVKPPALQVTVKSIIALPPLLPGAVKASVAVPGPGVPTPAVGAAGALAVMVKPCVTGVAGRKSMFPP